MEWSTGGGGGHSFKTTTLPPPSSSTSLVLSPGPVLSGCYNNYQNCTMVQSHAPCPGYGAYATLPPKTLIFPVFVQVRDHTHHQLEPHPPPAGATTTTSWSGVCGVALVLCYWRVLFV